MDSYKNIMNVKLKKLQKTDHNAIKTFIIEDVTLK